MNHERSESLDAGQPRRRGSGVGVAARRARAVLFAVALVAVTLGSQPALAGPAVRLGDAEEPAAITETGTGPAIDPNERPLLPASDLVASGVEAVGIGTDALYVAVADGISLELADDATYVAASQTIRQGVHRVGLTEAPSGNVIRVAVHYRAAATETPTTINVSLYDGERRIATGPRHELAVERGWVDLVDDLGEVFVPSAEHLAIEVAFDSGTDGVGSGRYSALVVQTAFKVSLAFDAPGLAGGGDYTAVALADGSPDTVLVGSAATGLFRSTDGGRSFGARNVGMRVPFRLRILSLASHPTQAGVAYAVAGSEGEDVSLLRSEDDGATWVVAGALPFRRGEGERAGRPGPVGSVLAMWDEPSAEEDAEDDEETTTIWAATDGRGVMRSPDGGVSWEALGLEDLSLRGLAQDPDDADVLYLASAGSGTWVTTDARATDVTFSRLPGGPDQAEEVAFVGDRLYVAGGSEGLFRLDGSDLVAVSEGVPLGAAIWTSIAGYEHDDSTVLFAACDPCQAAPDGRYASIIRSVDGGRTWDPVTTEEHVDLRVVGTGEPWSLAEARPEYVPGDPGFSTLQLVARAPQDGGLGGGTIFAAAPGGVWRSADGGDTWAPVVHGLGGLGTRGVAGDPIGGQRVFLGADGLGSLASDDGLDDVDIVLRDPPGAPGWSPRAYATVFDTTTSPSTAIVALGDAGKREGGIYASAGSGPDRWEDTGFTADVPGMRPTSLAVGRDARGDRVLLATAHPGGGIARKVAEESWVRVDADDAYSDPKSIRRADLHWVRGTGVVYLLDPTAGVFRSDDAGLTWTLIWRNPSNVPRTGGLAVTPDADVVFVASNQGVHRLQGATSGTVEDGGIDLTQLGTFRRASDVALDDEGRLWVVTGILSASPPRLAVSWDPLADEPTIHDLATEDYVNTAIRPDSLHITDEGCVIVADTSFGTVRGCHSDTDVEPWLPVDIELHPLEQSEGPDAPIESVDETAAPALADPFVVHVAPDGDDARDGLSADAAVLTLSRAQEILQERFGDGARELDSDVLIQVRPGRYVGQSVTWTFTHPEHTVRIAGHADAPGAFKPSFVGCGEPSCASARPWFFLPNGDGEATNVQLVNLRVAKYNRAIVFQGGADIETGWNGFNVVHRSDFYNIGTRYRSDIGLEVWSPSIISLKNSRSNRIWHNRFSDSSNRLDHTNGHFHTIYANRGASDNSVRFNEIVNTSGDFRTRNQSDRNVFADNVIRESFLTSLVTDWHSEVETESCETEISGNTWFGDWHCELPDEDFRRTTASPDGRCASSDLEDYTVSVPNEYLPAGPTCVVH